MPVVRSDFNLARPLSVSTVSTFLKSAFAAVGLNATPAEFDRSGRRHLVWEYVADQARTYGRFYYAVSFTASNLRQAICATYDSATNAFPANTGWTSDYSFQSSGNLIAVGLRSAEAGIVILRNEFDSGGVLLGWMRPGFKPSFWSEDTAPYVFYEDIGNSQWISTERNPYGEGMGFRQSWSDAFPPGKNPINGQIDILTGLYFYSANNDGVVGAMGVDWARATDNLMLPGAIIALANGQQYMVFAPGSSAAGAAVVRTV